MISELIIVLSCPVQIIGLGLGVRNATRLHLPKKQTESAFVIGVVVSSVSVCLLFPLFILIALSGFNDHEGSSRQIGETIDFWLPFALIVGLAGFILNIVVISIGTLNKPTNGK